MNGLEVDGDENGKYGGMRWKERVWGRTAGIVDHLREGVEIWCG